MFVIESLESGSYTVKVETKGYQDWEKEVEVNDKGKMVTIKLKQTES